MAVLAFLASWAPLSAEAAGPRTSGGPPAHVVPLKLASGREIKISDLMADPNHADGFKVVTDTGVVIPLKRYEIESPARDWFARIQRRRELKRPEQALKLARLLKVWAPDDPNVDVLLAELLVERYGAASILFEQALARGDAVYLRDRYESAQDDSDLREALSNILSREARRAGDSLDKNSIDQVSAMESLLVQVAPDLPALQILRSKLGAARSEREALDRDHVLDAEERRQTLGFQNAINQSMRYSHEGSYEKAVAALNELGPENADHPDVLRARRAIDTAEAYRRKPQAIDRARRAIAQGRYALASSVAGGYLELNPEDQEMTALFDQANAGAASVAQSLRESQAPGRGTRVELRGGAGSYHVYIPESFNAWTPSPILYAFSADGDGSGSVRGLAPIADKHGMILVASDFKIAGAEWRTVAAAQDLLLEDVSGRFSLDGSQGVATGFGEGSKAAIALANRHPEAVRGVVAQGSGLPPSFARPLKPYAIVFVAGSNSPAYRDDIPPAANAYKAQGLAVDVWPFQAGHVPPPQETIAQAVDHLFDRWRLGL